MTSEIFEYILRKIKQLTYRQVLKAKVRKRIKQIAKLSRKEQAILRMVKSAMADKFNKLTVAPISGTKYITMLDEDMYVILGQQRVIITNHKFFYDFDVSINLSEYLVDRFDRILEHECNQMEKEIVGNVEMGLNEIANKIDKKIIDNGGTVRRYVYQELEKVALA